MKRPVSGANAGSDKENKEKHPVEQNNGLKLYLLNASHLKGIYASVHATT